MFSAAAKASVRPAPQLPRGESRVPATGFGQPTAGDLAARRTRRQSQNGRMGFRSSPHRGMLAAMNSVRRRVARLVAAAIILGWAPSLRADEHPPTVAPSRANSAPRKIVVSSALADFSGPLAARLTLARQLVEQAARTAAQVTAPGVLVQQIDLAYAILHWSENLHEGHALTDRFGAKVGGSYSSREDTGVFWSNDPQLSIGAMIREVGVPEMSETIERVETARQNRAK